MFQPSFAPAPVEYLWTATCLTASLFQERNVLIHWSTYVNYGQEFRLLHSQEGCWYYFRRTFVVPFSVFLSRVELEIQSSEHEKNIYWMNQVKVSSLILRFFSVWNSFFFFFLVSGMVNAFHFSLQNYTTRSSLMFGLMQHDNYTLISKYEGWICSLKSIFNAFESFNSLEILK